MAALIGTPWALYLAVQLFGAIGEGLASVAEYAALFGVGWLVYVALIRRALGRTTWKDPHSLWWACICVNALWILVLLFGVGGPSAAGFAALVSATASVAQASPGCAWSEGVDELPNRALNPMGLRPAG